MNQSDSRRFTIAWVLLTLVTLAGFAVAETIDLRAASVGLIMALSGYKVRLILYRFMELGKTPPAFRVFFNLWLVVCVLMIFGLFWLAS